MRNIELFDLDGTVIDSSIRVVPCLRPNGDLDLDKYIAEACTEAAVNTDTLLPLASYMKAQINSGKTLAIVTARFMQAHDYVYLRKEGLQKSNVIICSRDRLRGVFGKEEGDRIHKLGDAEYKRAWFNHLWHTMPQSTFTIYDDHQGVLEVAQSMGITAIDATKLNKMLDQQFATGYEQGEEDSETMINSYMEELQFMTL